MSGDGKKLVEYMQLCAGNDVMKDHEVVRFLFTDYEHGLLRTQVLSCRKKGRVGKCFSQSVCKSTINKVNKALKVLFVSFCLFFFFFFFFFLLSVLVLILFVGTTKLQSRHPNAIVEGMIKSP